MAKIKYSDAATQDLEQIGDYISETLKNPIAARNTVSRIQDAIDKLEEFPLIGSPLIPVMGSVTDYRFLVCGNYLAFYRVEDDIVSIGRILYGKRNYLSVLFPNIAKNAESYFDLDKSSL